jgi:uncharacterized protein YjiS (DUF1127 family)
MSANITVCPNRSSLSTVSNATVLGRLCRDAMTAPLRLIQAIRTYRSVANELDTLTDGDFRDLPIKRADVSAVARAEALRCFRQKDSRF